MSYVEERDEYQRLLRRHIWLAAMKADGRSTPDEDDEYEEVRGRLIEIWREKYPPLGE